jgi:hypothetical protein
MNNQPTNQTNKKSLLGKRNPGEILAGNICFRLLHEQEIDFCFVNFQEYWIYLLKQSLSQILMAIAW